MKLVVNDRTKFWLKVALTVTFPAWILPALVLAAVALLVGLIWACCCSMVDDLTRPRP